MDFILYGVKIRIKFSFILIISFSLLTGADSLIYVLLFSSLHEAGHIISLYLLGAGAERITLSFYGIGLTHKAKLSRGEELIFLLSGCAVNLVFVLLGIRRDINLPLFILNILPVYPLDGGRALSLLTGLNIKLFYSVSFTVLAGIIIYSVYTVNFTLLLISVYLCVFAVSDVMR